MLSLIRLTYFSLVTLLPLAYLPAASELFEYPKFLLLLSATIIVGSIWAARAISSRRFSLPLGRYPALSYSVLAILITQAFATLLSLHPSTSFWGYYSRYHQGLLTTLCYTILYFGALEYLSLRDLGKMLKLSVATALLIAALALLERFDVSATCILINQTFTNSCWQGLTNPTFRSFATLGQPNWLAAYLVPHIFLFFYLTLHRDMRSTLSYALFALGYTLLFTALLMTKSRSGLLAFGFSFFAYGYLLYRRDGRAILKSFTLIALLPFAIYLATLFPRVSIPSPAPTPEAIATGESTASGDIRQIVWTGALKLFLQRPLFGFGPETFAYTYYAVRPLSHNYTTEWDYLYNKAHNEYLNYAATSGLIGLFAYLYFHLTLTRVSLSPIKRSKKTRHELEDFLANYFPSLGAALVSFTVTNFFGFSVIPVYLGLILMAAFANIQSSPRLVPTINYQLATASAILLLLAVLPLRLLLADLAYARGRTNLSIPELETAVRLSPSEALYHSYLGEALSTAGQVERALKEVEATRRLNPHHLNYYKSRAKIYITLAESDPAYYSQAALELEQSRTLAPTDPKLAYNLGLVYSRLGDSERSIREMQSSIELKNDYYEPYYALTLLYESTNQTGLIPPLLEEARTHLSPIPESLQTKLDKYLNIDPPYKPH